MIDSLRDLLDAFDPTLPLDRARTIPSPWYFDSELADLERRTVFAGWQAVGRLDQVDGPGAYLTAEVAGEPIAVVRDDAGVLRAFHNVCRHRAAPVLCEPCGTATKLRCRYHGWTYDLTGRLRGTPEFDGVADFRREDFGLVPMIVDTWGPTVWVHPQSAALRLADFLHPLPDHESRGVGSPGMVRPPDLRPGVQLEGLRRQLPRRRLPRQHHPPRPGRRSRLRPIPHGPVREHATCRSARSNRRGRRRRRHCPNRRITAYYWWVFPNFMVNLYAGVMDTNLVLPLGPERCRVVFDFYFASGTPDAFADRASPSRSGCSKKIVGICEDVQRGLQSRSFSTGRFSVRRENGGYQFHQLLARALRGGLQEEPAAGA